MKTGGQIIYSGPLGQHSSRVIEYFESIIGVHRIKENYNPATWMLDVTSTSAEVELGEDFADIYSNSSLYKDNEELVRQLCSPLYGSKNLKFSTRFAQNGWGQFKACLWKQHLSNWRSPNYNLTRILHKVVLSFLYGLVFWKLGNKIHNQQDLFNIFGYFFTATLFYGINNCSAAMPYVATERNVMYREQFAGMYTSWAYSVEQLVVELPYSFIQALLILLIVFPMVGFIWSAYKMFWFFYATFCTMLVYNYLGVMLVSLTPNVNVAMLLPSAFYTVFNLFSGFTIPEPQIPRWWVWLYYLTPISWILKGLFTSQYGDVDKEIMVFGETKTVAAFLRDYYGFRHDHLSIVSVVMIAFPITFAVIFAYCIQKLNFQRR